MTAGRASGGRLGRAGAPGGRRAALAANGWRDRGRGRARGPQRSSGGAEPRGEAGRPAAAAAATAASAAAAAGLAALAAGEGLASAAATATAARGQLRGGVQGGCAEGAGLRGGPGSREIHLLVTEQPAPRPGRELVRLRLLRGRRGRAGPRGGARAGPPWVRRQPRSAAAAAPGCCALSGWPAGRLVRSRLS